MFFFHKSMHSAFSKFRVSLDIIFGNHNRRLALFKIAANIIEKTTENSPAETRSHAHNKYATDRINHERNYYQQLKFIAYY